MSSLASATPTSPNAGGSISSPATPPRGSMAGAGSKATTLEPVRDLLRTGTLERGTALGNAKALQASFSLHNGSRMQCSVDWTTTPVGDQDRWTVAMSSSDPMDHEAIRALDHLLGPADPKVLVTQLGRLKLLTVNRPTDQQGLEVQLAAYAAEAKGYPGWAIAAAISQWTAGQKFWPSWAELRLLLENQVAFPRALRDAYRRARPAEPRVEKRDPMAIPRDRWTLADWDQHVRSALAMADTMGVLNQKSRGDWIGIAYQRHAEAQRYGHLPDVQLPPLPEPQTPEEDRPNE